MLWGVWIFVRSSWGAVRNHLVAVRDRLMAVRAIPQCFSGQCGIALGASSLLRGGNDRFALLRRHGTGRGAKRAQWELASLRATMVQKTLQGEKV